MGFFSGFLVVRLVDGGEEQRHSVTQVHVFSADPSLVALIT